MKDDICESMAREWGAPVVARAEVGKFSGGAISPKFCANQDCLGTGPKRRFMIGRRIVYRVDEFVAWMRPYVKAV